MRKKRKRESDSTVLKTDRPNNRVLSPRIPPVDQMQVASGPSSFPGEKSGDRAKNGVLLVFRPRRRIFARVLLFSENI